MILMYCQLHAITMMCCFSLLPCSSFGLDMCIPWLSTGVAVGRVLGLWTSSDEVLFGVSWKYLICFSWCCCHPIISCFVKIQHGFLVPAYPGKEAVRLVSVWPVQCTYVVYVVRWICCSAWRRSRSMWCARSEWRTGSGRVCCRQTSSLISLKNDVRPAYSAWFLSSVSASFFLKERSRHLPNLISSELHWILGMRRSCNSVNVYTRSCKRLLKVYAKMAASNKNQMVFSYDDGIMVSNGQQHFSNYRLILL